MSRYLLAAIGGGLASALVYALTGMGSFGGILLAYFAPLPLYLIGLSFGWTAGAAASAVGAPVSAARPACSGLPLASARNPRCSPAARVGLFHTAGSHRRKHLIGA